jgi:hypothetical protein
VRALARILLVALLALAALPPAAAVAQSEGDPTELWEEFPLEPPVTPTPAAPQQAQVAEGEGGGSTAVFALSLLAIAVGVGALAVAVARELPRSRAASAKRVEQSRPEEPEPEPEPETESCVIRLSTATIKKHFYAEAPGGEKVAKSPFFRVEEGVPIEASAKAAAAYGVLLERLADAGWDVSGVRRGERDVTVRRRIRAAQPVE